MVGNNVKSKKKILTSVLIVLLTLIAIIAAICLWQRENINAFIMSVNYDKAQIAEKIQKNDQDLKQEVERYFPNGIREFTEDEKKKIASGEVSEKQILAKILSESERSLTSEEAEAIVDAIAKKNPYATITYNPETVITPTKKSESTSKDDSQNKEQHIVVIGRPSSSPENNPSVPEKPNPSQESIISKHVSRLYALEGKYISAIERVVSSAKSEAKSKGLQKKDTSQLLAIGASYTGIVNSLEASCDAEVEGVISSLKSELEAINGDLSIISTIRSAYANEKSLKRAYYMSMLY